MGEYAVDDDVPPNLITQPDDVPPNLTTQLDDTARIEHKLTTQPGAIT